MNRICFFLILSLAALSLFGCRRDAEPDALPEAEAEAEAEAEQEEAMEEPAAQEPTVPMCGQWVVVVESPTVAGDVDGDRITRALIDGMRNAGCAVHTALPSGLPAGTGVLRLAPRIQSMGGTSLNISVIATDAAAGEVHSRYQERVSSGDGTAEARALGESIAGRLAVQ